MAAQQQQTPLRTVLKDVLLQLAGHPAVRPPGRAALHETTYPCNMALDPSLPVHQACVMGHCHRGSCHSLIEVNNMNPDMAKRVGKQIRNPEGMVLVWSGMNEFVTKDALIRPPPTLHGR